MDFIFEGTITAFDVNKMTVVEVESILHKTVVRDALNDNV